MEKFKQLGYYNCFTKSQINIYHNEVFLRLGMYKFACFRCVPINERDVWPCLIRQWIYSRQQPLIGGFFFGWIIIVLVTVTALPIP